MRFGTSIFLGYLLIALLTGYFVLNVFVDEIKPSARQSMEDSLVDSANLLAELAVDDVKAGQLSSGSFARHVAAYQGRTFDATIWGFSRISPGFRLYITDVDGVVRYDSKQEALGQDFSKWNDVYLTLKGRYGVRSSLDTNGQTTTMHVAAPIKSDGKILGVLTIAKSNLAVEPFIDRTRLKIKRAGYWLLAASLLIGALISYWLSSSVKRLVSYAEAVARGQRIFDRYYSLHRPEGGPKSTGLGLTFVRQVMILHAGSVEVSDHAEGGVEAVLRLPRNDFT